MIRRRSYIKRSRPVRASVAKFPRKELGRHARPGRNRPRALTNWKRSYHSAARVAFVKALPCVACGYDGHARRENAHTYSGGMGRKSDYLTIVPLCVPCHHKQHTQGWATTLNMTPKSVPMTLAIFAAETQARWKAHQERTP